MTIIPVNDLRRCKSRLSSVLSAPNRAELTLRMLESVLEAVMSAGDIVHCLVVSREARVLQFAERKGAAILRETVTGLNAAILEGIQWAIERRADSVLILPADLPFLRQADVDGMTAMQQQDQAGVVIAPSTNGTGTNGLLLSPPAILAPEFGPHSFARHLAQARQIGVTARMFYSYGTSRDIDNPEDLRLLDSGDPRCSDVTLSNHAAAIP